MMVAQSGVRNQGVASSDKALIYCAERAQGCLTIGCGVGEKGRVMMLSPRGRSCHQRRWGDCEWGSLGGERRLGAQTRAW